MALKLVLLLALAAVVRAQLPGLGSCPAFTPVKDFDVAKFMGIWYENERYFSVFEVGTRCSSIEYKPTTDGTTYKAFNTITSRITGITRTLNGNMTLANTGDAKEGRLSIRYDLLPLPINTEYSVLATDYDNYAILWSCSRTVPYVLTSQNAWLMTRAREPSSEIMATAIAIFDKLGINRRIINKVDQTNCPAVVPAVDAAAAPAETVAPVVAPVEAPAPTTVAPARTRKPAQPPVAVAVPAVRNQQVHMKPEVNAVEVEVNKPVVAKDEEVKVPEEPAKVEEVEAVPEPVAEPAPEPTPEPVLVPAVEPQEPVAVPEVITPVEEIIKPTDADIVKTEKVDEPVRIIEDIKAH